MSLHDIERKLSDKVDKWELHKLQSENRQLQSLVRELEQRVEYLNTSKMTICNALYRFFDLLMTNQAFAHLGEVAINDIEQLKREIYY